MKKAELRAIQQELNAHLRSIGLPEVRKLKYSKGEDKFDYVVTVYPEDLPRLKREATRFLMEYM